MRPPIDWTKPIRFVGVGATCPARVLDVRPLDPQVNINVAIDFGVYETVRQVSRSSGESKLHHGYIENTPPPAIMTYHNYYANTGQGLAASNARTRAEADRLATSSRTHVICVTQDGDEVTARVEKV